MKRRQFNTMLFAAIASSVVPLKSANASGQTYFRYLRPPGALNEKEFLAKCIGCSQCAQACPNRCISYFSPEQGLSLSNTPYIVPREKACILCMRCGDACPTGAIQKIKREENEITTKVHMGKARVDKTLCLSYQGKTCGVCYRACPLQDVAIKAGRLEQPQVLDACVGCGLCERVCIQMPQAIKIIPQTPDNREAPQQAG